MTPVNGVREELAKRDPALGKNPLIFPTEEFTKNCTTQPDPPGSEKDQQKVVKAFQDVVTG